MAFLEPRHSFVTAVWITLNALPLLIVVLLSLAFESWLTGLILLTLYLVLLIPYGMFVSLPLMGKLFRAHSRLQRR